MLGSINIQFYLRLGISVYTGVTWGIFIVLSGRRIGAQPGYKRRTSERGFFIYIIDRFKIYISWNVANPSIRN